MSTRTTVHVFAGQFASRGDATAYSEPQWAAEPGEDASDEEYAAWEDVNPSWRMRDELGIVYLDADFVETIHDEDPFEYLGALLDDSDAIALVRRQAGESNTLVLIFEAALDGFDVTLRSTAELTWCGTYPARFR